MPSRISDAECPPEQVSEVLEVLDRDDDAGLDRLDVLLRDYALDPRLHFLRGSILAGQKRYEAAIVAIARAVEIAPSFTTARFQLGLLHFTSGDAETAEGVWAPLLDLPADDPLNLFVTGLNTLARDAWREAVALIERGIGLNTQNPPLNASMRMLVDEVRAKFEGQGSAEAVSAAHLLLQRYDLPGTKH